VSHHRGCATRSSRAFAGELGNGLALSGGDGSGALTQGCGDPELNLRRGSRAGLDLRGHGDSDTTFAAYDAAAASDVVALVEHLGGSAVLVGNSMGAGVAVIVAATRPELVTALVLLGPFVRNVPSPVLMRWGFRLAMAGPWSTRVWLSYLPKLYPTHRGEDFDQHHSDIAAAMKGEGRAAAFRAITRTDHAPARAVADQVGVPTLVVMGNKDPDFPDPAAEADLVARTLGATVVMVPEVTGPAVVDFVTGLATSA